MSIKSILIVSANYPSVAHPTHGTFVHQLAHTITDLGINCSVIAPVAWHRSIWGGYQRISEEVTSGGRRLRVYRPRFLSLSARKSFSKLGSLNPSRLTFRNFYFSVKSTLINHNIQVDVLYGHFMFSGGASVVKLGLSNGVPAFVGVGEGEFWTVEKMGENFSRKILTEATGFIANSSDIKKNLLKLLGEDKIRVDVFPNGVNISKFKPLDKNFCREELGIPKDKFVVGAVGNYTHNKGIARVAQAIQGMEDTIGVFAGSGSETPEGENVVFSHRIPHEQVPLFLSALDVFVLPTLVEGCSNALIEAMACGLPIVSSNYSFNRDILDDSMSYTVDPLDISQIRSKLEHLRTDNKLRIGMGENALSWSGKFDIKKRAARIIRFMENRGNV